MKTKRLFYSKGFFYSLAAVLIIFGSSRSFGYEWSKTFGGSNNDVGHSVKQTTDGGFIVSGDTYSFGDGGSDVYLIKTDANGTEQWSKTFDLDKYDSGRSVQQTSDGGFIIAGSANTGKQSDVFLIKTYNDGNELWNKTYGGSGLNYGSSVQQTTDGGYIIAGGTEKFGLGDGSIYLIKTDGDGNELWSKGYNSRDGAGGHSVQQTTDGGYIIVGATNTGGKQDVYLVKTDVDGNKVWEEIIEKGTYGNSVQQTNGGGFIIAGMTADYGAGGADVFLINTDFHAK